MAGAVISTDQVHYRAPGWFTRNLLNRLMVFATTHGISVWGSRLLRVRGRSSGTWRETPVNPLDHDGVSYLVAPRGETQWVRNLRAAGGGELVLGRHCVEFRASEVGDDAKVEVLRAYLRRWKAEAGAFFEGVGPDSSDAEIAAVAPKHPVFRLHRVEPAE